ncbi:MAG: flagellar motor switch protein FliN [Thermodesulfobacteriota bacterium]|nr:flagellar motor switch protein FliN [Thermodesulfobacteriota bacterium]
MAGKVEEGKENQGATSPNKEDGPGVEEASQEETTQASNEAGEAEDIKKAEEGEDLDDVIKDGEESSDADQDSLAQEWEEAIKEEQPGEGPHLEELKKEEKVPTQKAAQDLDFILDIPLDVTVEIGRTKMIVNDLLQMGQGYVIELDKLAGESVDVLVNNKLIARGDVVVVSDRFGIRITDIVSPLERVKKLR